MLVKPLVRPIVRAIAGNPTASLGSGFSPTSLFADGSKGVVYDNNDLSSFYLDSAGTTPATVNGLVGLQLDKSAGLAISSTAELVTNGTFPTDTSGWTLTSGTASVTQGAGGMTVFSSVTATVAQAITTVVGKNYRYSVEITANNGAAFLGIRKADNSTASVNIVDLRVNSNGVSVGYFTATATTTYIVVQANTGASITVDNISLTEWYAGNHRYQTTTGSKPVLRGTPTGANTVSNPNFDSATGWTTGTNWSISSGVATSTGANQFQALTRGDWSGVAGNWYKLTIDISAYTSGSLLVRAGSGTNKGTINKGGVSELYFQADGAGLSLLSNATGFEFIGSITSIDVRDVSAGSVTAPYGLQYDGVDDFMQTAAVDFTATDKMFVCAGVRKLSDVATALILELGANSSVASSSFGFQGPSVSGANKFNFNTGGTIVVVPAATTTTYNAPYLGVLTGVGNIAGDSAILRINGVEIQNLALDQGTGNYANAVLYFGRRGGTSIPYNGLDFGMVICGKTLTSTQISSTERYIAQRTGVTI